MNKLSEEIKLRIDGMVREKMIGELGHVRILVQRTNNLLDELKIQLSEMKERVHNLGLVVMELREKDGKAPYSDTTAMEGDKTTVGGGASG